MSYCDYIPRTNRKLFDKLSLDYSRKAAVTLFHKLASPKFYKQYKDVLDFEKVLKVTDKRKEKEEFIYFPTYESLMSDKGIKIADRLAGEKAGLERLNRKYTEREDTINNYDDLLQQANLFNTQNPQRDIYVATVEYTDSGKIRVVIQEKDDESENKAKSQRASHNLNKRLATIFSKAGVTVGNLTEAEVKAGRVGVTDFSVVKRMANSFANIVRVANNKEGDKAVSEEFSHLIIGIFRNNPFIQRMINYLAQHEEILKEILGTEYEDVSNFYRESEDETEEDRTERMLSTAEEALGHLLQENLLQESERLDSHNKTLSRRTYSWIINQFKGYDDNDVYKAMNEIEAELKGLSSQILNGELEITEEDILNSQRDIQLNALSDRINRNLEILKKARINELKRSQMYENNKEKYKNIANSLEYYFIGEPTLEKTTEGILKYALACINEFKNIQADLNNFNSFETNVQFNILRNVRRFFLSYQSFIDDYMSAFIEEDEEDGPDDNIFKDKITIIDSEGNPIEISPAEVMENLKKMNDELKVKFKRRAKPLFAQFLKKFVEYPEGFNVEEMLNTVDEDISGLDRWFDSMAASSSVLLQSFDQVMKKVTMNVRKDSLMDYRVIQDLRIKFEKEGITDFEWMFERNRDGHKTGNYIGQYNMGQFKEDYRNMLQELDDKYGEDPEGEDLIAKRNERNAWMESHCQKDNAGDIIFYPNDLYLNQDYLNLDSTRKDLLEEFLTLKEQFDLRMGLAGRDEREESKAIQLRKSSLQRLGDSFNSASSFLSEAKGIMKESFMRQEDDDAIFGSGVGDDEVKGALRDFDGSEFMLLPKLYTRPLKNPDELSTDVFKTLTMYAYAATNYNKVSKVIDALEVGRILVREDTQVQKKAGERRLVEKVFGEIQAINELDPNLIRRLDDFFSMQVYQRYLRDQGTVAGVDAQKTVSTVIGFAAHCQLGFNLLAQSANVTLGRAMTRIEALSGQYFNYSELAKGDAIYIQEILPFVSELASRTKTSPLALFDELFDVKNDYKQRLSETQKNSIVERILGQTSDFIGQQMGDHYLYNRIALALATRKKVLLNGEEMTLWEALKQNIKEYGDDQKVMSLEGITELDGSKFEKERFEQRMKHINQRLFGIYNEEDSAAANSVILGRLAIMYRKWMKPTFNRMFQAKQLSLDIGEEEEGYYRTLGRITLQIAKELKAGTFNYEALKESLSENDKYNIKRAVFGLSQFLVIHLLAAWARNDKDRKKRPLLLKLANYLAQRLDHELGGVTPSLIMVNETLKTVQSPSAALNIAKDFATMFSSLITPSDYTEVLQSGPYKGMTKAEKAFYRAPIPVLTQYRQLKKVVDIDDSMLFYLRRY